MKKEPDNATETERSSLLNSVGRAFAENGVLRNVWEITGGKIKSREQALWLLAMIIAGLAGGAPALMAASTGALVRGIQRAGLLDLDVSSQEIYAKFAGMSPEEIYAEISEGLSEDAEETSNETPEGARRNYLKSLLRIPGGVFGIIGNALNTADRKILGVINNGAETRGVQYAREIAEALQQSSDYDGALAKYVDQSIGREELDRLIKEVRRAENEQAKEVAVKALRKKLNQMRRLVEDIAQLQAQGGVIVGGAAMGLRTAELSVGERSALSPQNLLNLRRNLEKAVDRIRQFLSYDNQEIDGMIADILDDMQSNEIDYNAEFRVKWWTFTAHALSKFLQSAAVHAGTDVVRDRLLGQFDMDIDAKKPSLEDQAIRVKSDAFGSSGGADLEAQAKMAEGMGYQREVEGVQFVDSTPDLSGGYSPDIIQTVDGQPVINLSPDVDGNRFWMENNLDLAQGDESHFAQRALQLLGYESTNPLINVTSKVMQSMERTLTPAEMETVVAAFNGADGIPASVAEAALEIGRGSDLANYAENMAILTEYVESQ
ncbi:hypothetical protein LRY60_02825 [Candidatus Woesebacteria bacterium]|nr:hypothetical protein [Candidatus Woesebacteria bacterium]